MIEYSPSSPHSAQAVHCLQLPRVYPGRQAALPSTFSSVPGTEAISGQREAHHAAEQQFVFRAEVGSTPCSAFL
jgi:hypothetical protein